MELIKPAVGLIFWASIAFLFLLFILRKFAWTPILKAVKDREQSIEKALEAADRARKEVESLKKNNDALMKEALAERDAILEEAKSMKVSILEDAKATASEEYAKTLAAAKEAIAQERVNAVNEIKTQMANLSLEIAQRVLEKEFEDKGTQESFVSKLVEKIEI